MPYIKSMNKCFSTSAIILTALTAIIFSGFASAAEIKDFTQQNYDKLMMQKKPLVVDVHATWCPVCKQQGTIITGLVKDPAYNDLTILKIDFDKQKTEMRQFNVSTQSTLIAFSGGKELTRSIGDTRPEGIKTLLDKAVKPWN